MHVKNSFFYCYLSYNECGTDCIFGFYFFTSVLSVVWYIFMLYFAICFDDFLCIIVSLVLV